MIFFRIFKHLLPNARAWRITEKKTLRDFFSGLAGIGEDIKDFNDRIWLDMFPETTREIDAWEEQFGIVNNGSSEQERRNRLSAAWKAVGGQDPTYIQETLQSNGFDVYLHEWWEPGTEPPIGVKACATPRNPLMYLNDSSGIVYLHACGEPLSQFGEPSAQFGAAISPLGYLLVNKGGNIPIYTIPNDSSKWPYFLYIGGSIFGELAQVDPRRRHEFENLCLKICPTQHWLGMLVEYN